MNCVRKFKKYIGDEPFNIRPLIEEIAILSFMESSLSVELSPDAIRKYGECLSEYNVTPLKFYF